MGDLLNFSPDRKLAFNPGRGLTFEPSRPLEFDPGRTLAFHPERDLGFGRKGVVFRGYVCPICGALVTEDAPKCTECGTVFEEAPRAPGPHVPAAAVPSVARGSERPGPAPPAAPLREEPRPPTKGRFCAFCGAKLSPSDTFCWNCGARSVGTAEAVRLPAAKAASATREWRGPEER